MKNTKNSEHMPRRATVYSAGYDIPVSETPVPQYFVGSLACMNDYKDVDRATLLETFNGFYQNKITLYPGVVYRFHTGLYLEHGDIMNYQYLKIIPRSSMRKYGLRMLNTEGIVDSDYRGEIQIDVCVEVPLTVNVGDRLCQMIVCDCGRIAGEIAPTEVRGEGGFGSTGN